MAVGKAWVGDWLDRIGRRVRQHGFQGVTAFAESRPLDSLATLAKDLGMEDVAAYQVGLVMRAEAETKGTTDRYVRDMLVRKLRERAPGGWGVSDDDRDWASRRASAYAQWSVYIRDEDDAAADTAWEAMEAQNPPRGWPPSSVDDPILERAFGGVAFDGYKVADLASRRRGAQR